MSYEECEHGSDPYCCLPCQGYRSTVVERAERDITCRQCGSDIDQGDLHRRVEGEARCYLPCTGVRIGGRVH